MAPMTEPRQPPETPEPYEAPEPAPAPAPEPAPEPVLEPDDALPRRRRPFGLLVLAGLLAIKAVIILIVFAGGMAGTSAVIEALRVPPLLPAVHESAAASTTYLLVAGLLILSAFGLLTGKRAGWLMAMVLTGAFIAIDIITFLAGYANHLWMLLNIITVFYLNQADVRAEFDPDEDLDDEPIISGGAA